MQAEDGKAELEVTIPNSQGLHLRPVARFVDLASKFECAIQVRKGDKQVDGKSTMEMMLLVAPKGTVLTLIAQGTDARRAVQALSELVHSGFGEE